MAAEGDPRWQRLADVVVGWSAAVTPGQRVLVAMHEPHVFPLVRAVAAAAVRAGAVVHVEFASALIEADLLRLGTEEQAAAVPEQSRSGIEWADVYIGVRGTADPAALAGVSAERIALHRRALGELSALRTARTRWVLVRVPGEQMARRAGLGPDALMDRYFAAVLRDLPAESAEYRRVQELFAGAGEIRLLGAGTDVRFSVRGRRFLVEDGRINLPGGELYTAPLEDSAEGTVRFSFPGAFAGREVPGIELRFSGGAVVSARADGNEELLRSVLAMDAGACRLGEFGVGLNRGLDRPFGDPLLDEKIYASAHLALGRSYAECGGVNRSALHWDLVTDLRRGGEILVDGKTVFSGGRFAI